METEDDLKEAKKIQAVNLAVLTSRPDREGEFKGEIRGGVCSWTALKVNDLEGLKETAPDFGCENYEKISAIRRQIWPLAFLENIESSPRREGHGSNGLDQFEKKVKELGCVCCLVWIAWPVNEEGGGMEGSLNFYEKNGWTFLFELTGDTNFNPYPPLAYKHLD